MGNAAAAADPFSADEMGVVRGAIDHLTSVYAANERVKRAVDDYTQKIEDLATKA